MTNDASGHAAKDIRYHDEIASEYDRVIVEPRWSSIDALFAPLRHHLPAQRKRMLDIGTGTGHMLRRYASLFERVVAIDHSEAMIAIARATAQREGLARVEFVVTDAMRFLADVGADERFDLVTCVGFLHHLQPRALADLLGAARRVLA